MNEKLTLKQRVIFTGTVTILIWSQLVWDYLHEGVPTHHILHRADLPGISNWWGGIILPLFTWFLLFLIQKRINENDEMTRKNSLVRIVYRSLGAFTFGISISFFFTIGADTPPLYMMLGIILVSFFIPLFRPEYFLGFVLGMTYTFGVILPIGIGSVLIVIFTIAYKLVRPGILYMIPKIS